jgi:hypothetical protein
VLAVTVVVILAARLAVVRSTPGLAGLFVSVSAAAWLAFLALTQRRISQLTQGHDQAPNRSVRLVVQLILMYEAVGAFLVLWSR